jgi:hypothetical protein
MKPTFQILIIPDAGPEEVLLCDGTLREAPYFSSMATQYPVGRGRQITDHIQEMPLTLSVDLLVTETPNRAWASGEVTDFSIVESSQKQGGNTATFLGPSRTLAPFERARNLVSRLNILRLTGQLVTVTTAIGQYERMAVLTINPPVEGGNQSVVVTVDFQQITIADSQVTADVDVPRLRRRTNGGQDNGATDDAPSSAAPQEADTSVLTALGRLAG